MKRERAAGAEFYEVTLEMIVALGYEGLARLHRVLKAVWRER